MSSELDRGRDLPTERGRLLQLTSKVNTEYRDQRETSVFRVLVMRWAEVVCWRCPG